VEQHGVGIGNGGSSLRIHMSSFLGIVGTHPAVFVRVANKGVTGYGTWKSAEQCERKRLSEWRIVTGDSCLPMVTEVWKTSGAGEWGREFTKHGSTNYILCQVYI
jgi:hypothetical protein